MKSEIQGSKLKPLGFWVTAITVLFVYMSVTTAVPKKFAVQREPRDN